MNCTNPTETITTYPNGVEIVEVKKRCETPMINIAGKAALESNYGGLWLMQCPKCKTIALC